MEERSKTVHEMGERMVEPELPCLRKWEGGGEWPRGSRHGAGDIDRATPTATTARLRRTRGSGVADLWLHTVNKEEGKHGGGG